MKKIQNLPNNNNNKGYIFFTFLFLIMQASYFGQPIKLGVNLYKDPVQYKANKKGIDLSLREMENCMKIWYFKDKKIYENTISPVGEGLSELIQIKMSENCIMLFNINPLLLFKPEFGNKYSEKVILTYYKVSNGTIDKSSIKYCWLQKKQTYSNQNKFTEELWINDKMYFIIEDHIFIKKLVIKNIKEINLSSMGANFCN